MPAENFLQNPDAVKTETRAITVGKEFNYTLPPMSVQFIRINAG
jgi:alpha-L-arabinofuranosidase